MTFPAHTDPILLRPGEGEYAIIGGNTRCTFKVTGRDTANRFGLFEFEMEAGAMGARPHFHHHLTEIFYVAEGEVLLLAGNKRTAGTRGTLLLVPPTTVHGFANPGNARAVLLIMFCPADTREKYFKGLAELTRDGRRPSHEELVALMRRFDQEPVEGIEFP